jgi:hypothetical protein
MVFMQFRETLFFCMALAALFEFGRGLSIVNMRGVRDTEG